MKYSKTIIILASITLLSLNACVKKVVIRPSTPPGDSTVSGSAITPKTNGNGHSIGNGGNFLKQEFLYYGRKTAEFVRIQNEDRFTENNILEVDHNKLFRAVVETPIRIVSEPFLDNQSSSADARLIEVDDVMTLELYNKPWMERLTYTDQMFKLVFHEYLRVLALDDSSINDDDYIISSKLDIKTLEPHPHLYETLSESFEEADSIVIKRAQGFYSGWCIESENNFEVRQSILAIYHYNISRQALNSSPEGLGYLMGDVMAEENHSKGTFEQWDETQRRDYVLNYRYGLSWAHQMSQHITSHVPDGARRTVFQIRIDLESNTILAAYLDLSDLQSPRNRAIFAFDENGNEIIPKDHIRSICYYNLDN